MAKRFKDTTVLDYKGEPIKMLKPDETKPLELSLKQILWMILNTAPTSDPRSTVWTQNDAIQGMRLALALDAADNGVIEFEDGVHDWLKIVAEKVTPQLFRVNGNLVYKHICEGFEKAN